VRKQGEPSSWMQMAARPRGRQRRRRCRIRQRVRGDDLQGRTRQAGVIFCSISEAIREHPELVKKYLGSVVPHTDNFYAALNSAVFTDGSFVYIPEGVRCPMELSTYFRINAENTGQFERTLIIADKGSYVSYLEGCTAPMRDENQLHAAVVELVALEDAEIKYSTVQNWYPGDGRQGRHLQLRHQAWRLPRRNSKISWTQVETGSAITWKYPVLHSARRQFASASSIRSPFPTASSRSIAAPR
jgi:Fe-S cluster assembly protein SufB